MFRWGFRLGLVLFAPLSFSACSAPKGEEIAFAFADHLHRYFGNLNRDAALRREALTSQQSAYSKNPRVPPPLGYQFNTFHFAGPLQTKDEKGKETARYPGGFVLQDVRCRSCARVYEALDYARRRVRCVGCGKVLIESLPADAKDVAAWLKERYNLEGLSMFAPQGEAQKLPLKATVRYVRKSWVYDPYGTVEPDSSLLSTAKKAEIIGAVGGKDSRGFHRLDGVYVGEQVFEFDGSSLRALGPAHERPVLRLRFDRSVLQEPTDDGAGG